MSDDTRTTDPAADRNPDPQPAAEPETGTHLEAGTDAEAGTGAEAAPASAPAPAADAHPAPDTRPAPGVRTQNRIAIVGTLALLVALIAGGAFLLGRGSAGDGERPSLGVIATPAPSAGSAAPSAGSAAPSGSPAPGGSTAPPSLAPGPYDGIPSDGARLGSADADLVIQYWADYQCPFCARFGLDSLPDLIPYLRDGTVAVEHRDFAFLGPESFDAAVAVRCADREGRFWAMHDAVYAAQQGENQGAFARERLVTIGESVGLDGAALAACLDDESVLVGVLDDTSAGVRVGVGSTPTVDVNGTRFLGVPKQGEMEAAIDAALAGASPQPLPTQPPITDPWAAVPLDGRVAGSPDAPVTVDLWMDYQSADSPVVARELSEGFRTRIADGSLRVVLHDLALLGDESETAASAVRCIDAQDGPAWLVHDVLALNARGSGSGIYTRIALLRFMTQLGLDIDEAADCVASPQTLDAIRGETAAGRELGLEVAPAVIVSAGGDEVGRFTGTLDADAVLASIDEAK